VPSRAADFLDDHGMPPITAVTSFMNGQAKVATIECATCAALLEVFPQDVRGEPGLSWNALDDGHLCRAPPLRRCPHARAEMKLRFPSVDL
jgi:hypothetical protein